MFSWSELKMNKSDKERLRSIRTRIKMLRAFLETTDPTTSISLPGFSGNYDRPGAIKELADLERQEARLSGRRPRARTIDQSGSF